jgi:peptidoglycan/LPS O-acetylase OafA/YrhL
MAKGSEIRSLTGLRGLAAYYVVLYHFGADHASVGSRLKVFVGHGYIAVDLFFVLSGFVMALTYASSFAAGFTSQAYLSFLTKRIARVWPLYIVVTIITMAVVGNTGAGAFLLNLVMIQSWGISRSIVDPAWSISTEWGAYLLFPLLVTLTLFCAPRRVIGTTLVTVGVLSALVLLPSSLSHTVRLRGPLDLYDGANYAPMVRCLTEFTLGLVAWRVARHGAVRRLSDRPAFSGAVALAVLLLLAVPDADLAVALCFPFLIVSVTTDRPAVARLLGARPVHWLGDISYALYLVHPFGLFYRPSLERVVEGTSVPHGWFVSLVLLFGSAILIAAVAHYVIEVPSRRLLRTVLRLRRETGPAEPATLAAP